MKYNDPVHKILKLLESENINPGNLLIGQTVDVRVTDARNTQFMRPMVVSEFYPDGQVLLKDELTQETITLQFQWNSTGIDGLVYNGTSDFGVTYQLIIDRNRMSNHSITNSLNEKRINESSAPAVDIFLKTKVPSGWKSWKNDGGEDDYPYFYKKNVIIGVDDNGKNIVVGYDDGEGDTDIKKTFKPNQMSQAISFANSLNEKRINESFNFNKIQSDEFEDDGHKGFEYKYYDLNDNLIVEVETWDDGYTVVNNWYNVKSQPFNIFAKLKKEYKSLKDFEKDLDKLLVN